MRTIRISPITVSVESQFLLEFPFTMSVVQAVCHSESQSAAVGKCQDHKLPSNVEHWLCESLLLSFANGNVCVAMGAHENDQKGLAVWLFR